MSEQPLRPWIGLEAYDEATAERFYGRRMESRQALALVEAATLSVIHGASGFGKTSILRAGLFPLLRQHRFVPVYVRLGHHPEAPPLAAQVLTTLAQATADAQIQAPVAHAADGLWTHFHRRDHRFWTRNQWPVTPVLVFDQFEEVFTLGQENEAAKRRTQEFLIELSDLVENRPPRTVADRLRSGDEAVAEQISRELDFPPVPVRVLLTLREDYLAHLEDLRGLFPGIRANRMRLLPMTRAQAQQVIEQEGSTAARLAPGATSDIVQAVSAGRGAAAGAELDEERPIEPAFLSLFCDELDRLRGEGQITPALVRDNRETIFSDFYRRALEIVADPGERSRAQLFVENELLSSGGFRDSRGLDDATTRGGVASATLEALVNRRLLRWEDRPGCARRVELSHDVLRDVVARSRNERQQREREAALERQMAEERQRAETAGREKETAQARERRGRRLLRAVIALLVLAMASLAVGWQGWRRARQADRAAQGANAALATVLLEADAPETRLKAIAHLLRTLRSLPDNFGAMQRLAWELPRSPLPRHSLKRDGTTAVALSPDGTLVATASTADVSTVRIWNVLTGTERSPVLSHSVAVRSMVFSPDSKRIATASDDGTARVWDATDGKRLSPPLAHDEAIVAMAFAPDGGRLAAAAKSGPLRIWDVATGSAVTGPLPGGGSIFVVAFAPDGKRLATVCKDKTASVWDLDADPLAATQLPHDGSVRALAFSPDGKRLATASSDKASRIWIVATGRVERLLLHKDWVNALAWSPDGRRLATASDDKTALIWDVETGEPLIAPLLHRHWVDAVAFSADGKSLTTATTSEAMRVFIWGTGGEQLLAEPLRHEDSVNAVAFSPDGRRIATASSDKKARLWDAATGKAAPKPLEHKGWVGAVAFSPDGGWLATASYDKKARVWDLSDSKDREPLQLVHDQAVNAIAFSRDGTRIATASDDTTARLWDTSTGELAAGTKPLPHGAAVNAVAFNPKGTRIVTGSDDKKVRVWDAATGRQQFELCAHQKAVRAVAFSPDGEHIATASSDATARIWSVSDRSLSQTLVHQAGVRSVAFSPNGKRIATASDDYTARIWDAATGNPLTEPLVHMDMVVAASFSPDGKRVATASNDKTARIWDTATGQPLSPPLVHENRLNGLAWSPDGERIATASDDSTARVWDVTVLTGPVSEAWLDAMEEGLGAKLSPENVVVLSTPRALPASATSGNDRWSRLARWLSSPAGLVRPITPFSERTVGQWVDARIAENTRDSLDEAYRALPGDPLVLAARAELAASPKGAGGDTALFYADYAVQHANVYAEDEDGSTRRPRQAQVHFRAARALHRLGRLDEARAVLATAMTRDPGRTDHAELAAKLALPPAPSR